MRYAAGILLLTLVLTLVLTLASVNPLGAQWTQGTGKLWVKTALFLQQTDERYNVIGNRTPYFSNGESDARAVFTDVIVGVRRNLDVWIQVPYFDFRFTDDVQRLTNTGFGDLRAWLRWQPFTLHNGQTPVTLRIGAKAPLGQSEIDAQIIPLGEGQWDVEGFAEIGHSFWPAPAYAQLWLGYRIRTENTETFQDPGDEYVYLAEVGLTPSNRFLVKSTLDGFFGKRFVAEGIRTATKRKIMTLQFGAAVRAGPVWPEAAIRIPLQGREFPAGPQFVVGFSSQVR